MPPWTPPSRWRGDGGPDRFRGLVNGVLRRIVRTGESLDLGPERERANVPDWLWRSWSETFGEETAAAIATAHLRPPPVDLTAPVDPDGWAVRLGGERIGAATVRLPGGGDIAALEGFADGAWWVQDAAAALPAQVLAGALPSGRVLDLCAAPGGKTAQLAASGYAVTALDIALTRLRTLTENLERLKLKAEIVEADLLSWRTDAPFDAILLDAPCTATGTIRRHPDIPHLKSAADVLRQADVQKKFLDRAAGLLAPGGVLVYSVCSMEPAEGPDQIAALLQRDAGLTLDPIDPGETPDFEACVQDDGWLQTTPAHLSGKGGVDGFFVARLRKSAVS